MINESEPTSQDAEATTDESGTPETEYDLPVELFAGAVVIVMGILVLATPLITEMPSNWVWDPLLMNLISGSIYVIAGLFLIYRAR